MQPEAFPLEMSRSGIKVVLAPASEVHIPDTYSLSSVVVNKYLSSDPTFTVTTIVSEVPAFLRDPTDSLFKEIMNTSIAKVPLFRNF